MVSRRDLNDVFVGIIETRACCFAHNPTLQIVQEYYLVAMAEGWLTDRERFWVVRFHRDERSWQRDPRVFVDYGREMLAGEPALLKSRRHLRRSDAVALWKALRSSGWVQTSPGWGDDAVA